MVSVCERRVCRVRPARQPRSGTAPRRRGPACGCAPAPSRGPVGRSALLKRDGASPGGRERRRDRGAGRREHTIAVARAFSPDGRASPISRSSDRCTCCRAGRRRKRPSSSGPVRRGSANEQRYASESDTTQELQKRWRLALVNGLGSLVYRPGDQRANAGTGALWQSDIGPRTETAAVAFIAEVDEDSVRCPRGVSTFART
jgi:hypothetical protein